MAYYPLLGEPVLNILAIVDIVVGLGSYSSYYRGKKGHYVNFNRPIKIRSSFFFNISSLPVTWAVDEYYMAMLIEFGTQDEQAVIIRTYL